YVLDRIMGSKRAAEIAAVAPEDPTIEELRARYGTGTDDDLLILKALIPEGDITAMQAAGSPRRDFPFVSSEVEEIRSLIRTTQTPYVNISTERFDLELRR